MVLRHALLWLVVLLIMAACADTSGIVEQVCPLCRTSFKAELDFSGTRFGQRLDLKPIGPIAAPWRMAVCPKCAFVLFKEEYSRGELRKLRAAVKSANYRKLVEERSPPHLMAAALRETLGESDYAIAYDCLCASWQAESDPDVYARCLRKCLHHLDRALARMGRKDDGWASTQLLKGEVLRRLSRHEAAGAHFRALATEAEFRQQPYRTICQFELALVANRNSGPHPTPEIVMTEEDIRQTPGFKALEGCPELAGYTNLFDVLEPEDEDGILYGVYLGDKPQWRGDFLPKKPLGFRAMAELVLGKEKPKGQIQVFLTPDEVMAALQEICDAPFVRELAKDPEFEGVRIRAAGDRLHWNTEEVVEHRQMLQRCGMDAPPMKQWVYAILDLKREKRSVYIGLYHPKGSDLYLVQPSSLFEVPNWRCQFEQLTGVKPEQTKWGWNGPEGNCYPAVDSDGDLRLLHSGPSRQDRAMESEP